MAVELHHLIVSVADMERSLVLFRDILGFDLVWHLPKVGGRKLAGILGLPRFEAEMAYLQAGPRGLAVELVRPIGPASSDDQSIGPLSSGQGLSLSVDDLDAVHRRLSDEGWPPFTAPTIMLSPEGVEIKLFCFRTEEGLTIELTQKMA